MHRGISLKSWVAMLLTALATWMGAADWAVVDTGQDRCYDDRGNAIECPAPGDAFCGQDAQFSGRQPQLIDNGDGTVTETWRSAAPTRGDRQFLRAAFSSP